jgi:hypothetical protein
MKNLNNTFFLTLISVLNISQVNAQTTVGSNTSGITLQYSGWDGAAGTTVKDYDLRNYHAGQAIRFYTWSTASTNAIPERMVITDDGKVGIGTSAPSYKLDVKDGTGNCNMRLQAQTSGSANVVLSRYSSGDNCAVNYKTGTGDVWFTGAFGDNNYRIKNASNTTNFIIDQTVGAVGIGSVSPVGKLYVSNDVNTTVLVPAIYANSTASTAGYSAIGVQSFASASGAGGNTYAIEANASGSGNLNSSLKLITTSNAANNYGIYSTMGKGIGYYSTVTGTSGSTTEQNGGIVVEVANGAYVGGVSGKASNGVTSNTGGTFEANGGPTLQTGTLEYMVLHNMAMHRVALTVEYMAFKSCLIN